MEEEKKILESILDLEKEFVRVSSKKLFDLYRKKLYIATREYCIEIYKLIGERKLRFHNGFYSAIKILSEWKVGEPIPQIDFTITIES